MTTGASNGAPPSYASYRSMRFPMPADNRGLFRLLSLYDRDAPLGALLALTDTEGVTREQVDFVAFAHIRRPPLPAASRGSQYRPHVHLESRILSQEFQNHLMELFTHAFPEAKRLIYIHIPRCAGTHFRLRVAHRYPHIPHALQNPAITPKKPLLTQIALMARTVDLFGRIVLSGHLRLNFFVQRVGVREADEIYTTIRDPVDLAVSHTDYVVQLLRAHPNGERMDARKFLDFLGMESCPTSMSAPQIEELATRIIYNDRILPQNPICWYLGDGTSKAAIDNIVEKRIEITTVERYPAWIEERWRCSAPEPVNRAAAIDRGLFVAKHAKRLADLTSEDGKVYSVVSRLLDMTGKSAIRGDELRQCL
jgi:hypothetical protein